mmetsp:Transcript_93041/g.199538  ORF Transcript_93041/g.199538 Transcript_93041/m.199538 type:complete len:289 (+) Transcript_93041:62-928(+)
MPLGFTPRYCQVEELLDKHILLVRLNREKNLNSLHLNCHWELDAVWNYFEENNNLWVGILTGNGRAFSAGNDLKATSGFDSDGDGKTFEGLKEKGFKMPASGFGGITDRTAVKPIIAAVNGVAHGGGFELALSCDILVVSEAADFALPEVRVGLYAAAGGVVKLPRLIGYQNAMAMILTGRRIKGAKAVEMGIAQQLVKDGEDLVGAALALAEEINLGNPDAVAVSVEVAKTSYSDSSTFKEAVANQNKTRTARRWAKGPNMKEGPLAFSQKRKPNWANPEPLPPAKL